MGSAVKARLYETGGIVFTEQRPLGLDIAPIPTVPSPHPSTVPETSVVLLLVSIVRGLTVGPSVFEELGFKI